MERVYQQAQVLGANTTTKLNELFRQKVTLEEQLKDVEIQLHYARGVLNTLGEIQQFIRDIQRGEGVDTSVRFSRPANLGGDGDKSKTEKIGGKA